MRTKDELVAWAQSATGGGFDVPPDRAEQAFTSALNRLAERSRWLVDERELGPTVTDQETYAVPSDALDIRQIRIGEDAAYYRTSLPELWQIKAGTKQIPPRFTGVFTPRFTGATREVGIYPIPDGGQTITGLCEILPETISGADAPPFPEDAEDAIRAYMKADLYDDIDEDPNSAQVQRAIGDAYAGTLYRRGRSQIGSGPHQMQVRGAHF